MQREPSEKMIFTVNYVDMIASPVKIKTDAWHVMNLLKPKENFPMMAVVFVLLNDILMIMRVLYARSVIIPVKLAMDLFLITV